MMEFYAETFSESLYKHNEELCGDRVSVIYDPDQTIMVLADGMGSGVRANILATLTGKIISTMLRGGATIDDCVETISKTLPVSSLNGVAYSTFTIITVKTSGEVYMAEFDGPEVIMIRDGILDEPPKTERVIAGKRVLESHFTAEPGDLLVAFSDGVEMAGAGMKLSGDWGHTSIMGFLQSTYRKDMTARDIVRALMDVCNLLYEDDPTDDVTTAAVRILPRKCTHAMVGPASSKDRDQEEVHRLMSAPGRRIVCGGTTSLIVSKVTGQPINVNYDSAVNGIPPTAEIAGTDLVTEGVLTLSAAANLLKRYVTDEVESDVRPDTVTDFSQPDGATQLVKMLVDESTDVLFLLGEATNEAHIGSGAGGTDIELDIKRRNVTDLKELLQKLGKNVRIERY